MLEGLIVSVGVFVILGIVTYVGAWYTTKTDSPRALLGIYILFLTLAQFFAAKIASFDLGLIVLVAPVGVIVFPFTLQVTDMVNEKFGRKAVYEMIWIAFISQIVMVVLFIFASFLPVLEGDDPLAAFAIVPAITLASWISFFISERFDAWLYDQEISQSKSQDLEKTAQMDSEARDEIMNEVVSLQAELLKMSLR